MPGELRRTMGLSHATAMVVGTILGASIFVQPSEISRHVPSIPGMMLVWFLAGLLTLCGALVCAELAAVFPRTGGIYVFLKQLFSPAVGFLWGWAMFWSVHSGIIAALALIFARYVGYFTPLDERGIRGVAIAGILLLSAVNYLGVRPGSALQLALTSAKLLAVVLILAVFFAFGSPAAQPATPPMTGASFSLRDFVLGLTAALFSFGGWHMVTYTADETREPQRTVPRALLIGTLTVTACYLGLNAAYLYVLPLDHVTLSTRVAADAAELVVGARGGAIISALVILSTFGALNGIILAGPRVYFAMAGDGLAFRWMGAVHPEFRTPHRAILLQAIWASLLVAMDTYRGLFTRVIYTEWLFFALMAASIFQLRRRPGHSPVFAAGGYPVVPLLFIASSLLIVLVHIVSSPRESVPGLLLVALGLPVYFLWTRSSRKQGAANGGY